MITKAEIQLVRSLSDKRNRDIEGLFVAEGEKLISEIRSSGLKIRRIYALEGIFEGSEVEIATQKELERLTLLKSANNSLALVEIPHYNLKIEALKGELTLALDEVQNPGNLGTIIRLADWFGIRHILCSPTTADCFNPKVVQATMGAILRVKVHYVALEEVLEEARGAGLPVYGTFLEGENIYEAALSTEGILLMGNEGRGISRGCAEKVSHKLLIPPYPSTSRSSESLNVAMATGIACSEFRRRIK